MDTITTILKHGSNKNCMLVLQDSYLGRRRAKPSRDGDGVIVYESGLMGGMKAYLSVLGKENELSSGDTVQLNAWYAMKLGIKDGEPLPLRRIKGTVARAKSVRVEPVSSDDWEILENNAGCVETVLLDQVRVVWQGQILPVWITRSICVYMKISTTEPATPCVILERNTEVVVAPKVRLSTPPSTLNLPSKVQRPPLDSPSRNQPERLTNSSEYDNVDILEPRPSVMSPKTSPRQSLKKLSAIQHLPSSYQSRSSSFLPLANRQSSLMESFMKYIFPTGASGEKKEVMDNLSDSDKGSLIDFSMKKLPSRNGVLRVQPLNLSYKLEECFPAGKSELNKQILSNSIFGFRNITKKPFFLEKPESPKYCSVPLEVFHPSTVYVDAECIKNERFIHPYLPHLPSTFIARLQRLPSPLEKMALQTNVNKTKPGKAKPADPVQADTANSLDNGQSGSGTGDQVSLNTSCYVRVVAIDRKAGLTDKLWQKAADQVLSNQPLLFGHVVIPDLLRRHLRLETTCSVWIQTGTIDFVIPRKVHIYILSNLPKTISNDLVIVAFVNYIKQCANEEHPLVVFQGIFLKFVMFQGIYAEVQLTFFGENDPGNVKAVTMLSEVNIDQVQIVIERDMWEDKFGVVNRLLEYCSTTDIDAAPLPQRLRLLGGMEDIAQQALLCLHASLASTPLSRETFQIRGGLSHGVLLITGPRGAGKSSLVNGLCRKMAQLPVLAHIAMVDCKQLRGKPVNTIQKNLEMVFDEAAWREPSIVVLENLDIIVPAPSGPEMEMTGESLYFAKIAQVLEGLIRYEIQNNSRVAVIATSLSRSSLHPSLISTRGVHCFQQMFNIGIPDKVAREKILMSMLQRHSNVSQETVKTLDIASVAVKTEGFVARDLELLVNRTLHARMSKFRDELLSTFTLTIDDFEETLSTFKPVSVRNVPLHKAGDLGWDDVGGLSNVKKVLMETLRWPTKYPQLFSSCPLRLRSGILLYGAPGTGKTLLAGVVAKECGLNFISVKGPELLNKYIGASEQSIRDLFTKAQSAKPCILFFDEFDSIAPKRGHDSTGVTDRVVNQLLTQLDGVEGLQGVYVLAATSRPDLIDPALLRPGRLDVCQFCAMPDVNERNDILVALTHKMSLAADVNLQEVAAVCENFTGADLKALLYNAQLNVIHEQTDGDRSLTESVVWIKGDSNQCGTTMRRASVVKDEAGSIRLNVSKSISVNSLGDTSAGGVPSPRLPSHSSEQHSSGNSSSGKTPKSPALKCKIDNLGDTDLAIRDDRTSKGDIVTGNIFQYPDQVENGSGDSRNSVQFDCVDGNTVTCDKANDDSVLSTTEGRESLELLSSAYSEDVVDNVSKEVSVEMPLEPNRGFTSTDEDFCDFGEALSNISKRVLTDVAKDRLNFVAAGPESHDDVGSGIAERLKNVSQESGDSLMNLQHKSTSYRKKRNMERGQARGSRNNLPVNRAGVRPDQDIKSPSKDRIVTVFTSLKSGLATLSAEDEARYISMVKEIQERDETLFEQANSKRRTSLRLESRMSVLMEVCQHHLIEAAKSMRPSVSSSERERYMKIYEHFVSSRKVGFDKIQDTAAEKRATLA